MRSTWQGAAGIALACVPCLLVLGVFGFAFVGFAAIGAWFSDNALVLGAAVVTAIAFAALAWAMYTCKARGAACEIDPAKEKRAWSRREPSASTPKRLTVVGGGKR